MYTQLPNAPTYKLFFTNGGKVIPVETPLMTKDKAEEMKELMSKHQDGLFIRNMAAL